jgi:hypothetical protein
MTIYSRFFRSFQILSISGCVFGVPAFAVNVRGNGGDVLLGCENNSFNGKVLDYYEAESLLGLQIDLDSTNSSPEQIAMNALSRIPSFDGERRSRLQGWVTEFMSDAVFAPGIQLKRIDDSGELGIPKGCRLEQAAVQEDPRFPEAKRYLVSKDVWDLMDKKNQAGLILHEVIYREAISYGHTDSIRTRYFNALISSGKIAAISAENYPKTLKYMDFPDSYRCRKFPEVFNYICFIYGSVSANDDSTTGKLDSPRELPLGFQGFNNETPKIVATFQNFVTLDNNGFVIEGTLAEAFGNVEAGHRVQIYRKEYSPTYEGLKDLGPDPSL